MHKERFYELSARYFSKELTSQEADELNAYLDHEAYHKLFQNIARNWENALPEGSTETFQWEENLALLRKKLVAAQETKTIPARKIYQRVPQLFLKIAATVSLLLISGIALYFLRMAPDASQPRTWEEKLTKNGQQSTLQLTDGSKITLNGGSSLRYPSSFSDSIREVFLEGEALFEVTTSKKKPFIVHAANVKTEVLGTIFNIKAFASEDSIAVALLEGKVKVSGEQVASTVLRPNQLVVYRKQKQLTEVGTFHASDILGWKNGMLFLDGLSLDQVAVLLERKFGVPIDLKSEGIKTCAVSGTFQKDQSIHMILEALAFAGDLSYEIKKENDRMTGITLTGSGCD